MYISLNKSTPLIKCYKGRELLIDLNFSSIMQGLNAGFTREKSLDTYTHTDTHAHTDTHTYIHTYSTLHLPIADRVY